MKVVAWREPPPRGVRRGQADQAQVAAELRARPGEWAYVGIRKSSSWVAAVTGRKPSAAWQPRGAYEARAVPTADGDYDVYVRYIGGDA